MLRKAVNHRFNPFTEATSYSTINSEVHLVPKSGVYWVRLNEVPDEDYVHPTSGTPLYIVDYDGNAFTQTLSSPGLNQYRVDYTYKTGWVEFNNGNAGTAIKISYRGTGSPVEAEFINSLQRFEPATTLFCGDGSDGTAAITTTTALAESVSGSKVAVKNYVDLTLTSGALTLAAGVRGMILAITGKLTVASGYIDVIGFGGAGATIAGMAGDSGGFGGGAGGGVGAGVGGGPGGPGLFGSMVFGPGAGVGGIAYGVDGANLVLGTDHAYWRSLINQMVFGAGGGAGSVGDDGGAGAGFVIINANILDVTTSYTNAFRATGGNGAGASGGGGAGGTIIVIVNHIIGATAAQVEASGCLISGGTSTSGGDGAAGYAKVVELYEYNVY